METNDISIKRAILFSARARFSPQLQSVRETAIDKIIEQNLLIADCKEGLTIKDIEKQNMVCFKNGVSALNNIDIINSLERLSKKNRVIKNYTKEEIKYRLSEEATKELNDIQEFSEKNFIKVIEILFGSYENKYKESFLDFLCILFSKLSDTYINILKGDIGLNKLIGSPDLFETINEINKKYSFIDKNIFSSAVMKFFQVDNPKYAEIKWNFAQNYYIAKAIGLDSSSSLLSKELFENAHFYLDTNIIINALEPEARHFNTFKEISKACVNLNIGLFVCKITIDELKYLIILKKELINKAIEQVPHETANKIKDIFFKIYYDKLKNNKEINIDSLFYNFSNPEKILKDKYNITIIDDKWFDISKDDKSIKEFAIRLQNDYKKIRNRPKNIYSAIHDALIMGWIELERNKTNKNTILITLDTTLPSNFLPILENKNDRAIPITLDALLQWISPIAIHGNFKDFSEIFSEAVKYQLLPQENFFELSDFIIFSDMDLECRELPAEDVEGCLRHIKSKALDLDISKPADREKLQYEISKYFTQKGRKYKKEIQRLKQELAQKDTDINKLKEEIKIKDESKDLKIKELESKLQDFLTKYEDQKFKKKRNIKIIIVFSLFVILNVLLIYLAYKYGNGQNIFQKIKDFMDFFYIFNPLLLFLSYFILGKKIIISLGWPFSKIFKE